VRSNQKTEIVGKEVIVLALLVLIVLAIGIPIAKTSPSPSSASSWSGTNPATLFTATEAISVSLELYPPGKNPHDPVARLIDREDLDNWRDVVTQSFDDGSEPAPVWLVGIKGDNLVVDDISPGEAVGDLRPLEGVSFAWDANGGFLLDLGALGSPWPQTYLSIVNHPQRSLIIQTATPLPTLTTHPTDDPNATPTDWPDGA